MGTEEQAGRKDYEGPLKANRLELVQIILWVLGLGDQIDSIQPIETQFKTYTDRRADMVLEIRLKDGSIMLLHIELQSSNDAGMLQRMLGYYVDIWILHGLAPLQCVVFTGQTELTMESTHRAHNNHFSYAIIDLRKISSVGLYATGMPFAAVLAPFADTEEKVAALYRTLKTIASLSDAAAIRRYISAIAHFCTSVKQLYQNKTLFDHFLAMSKEINTEEINFYDLLFATEDGQQKLQQATLKGILEGRLEGEQKGKLEGKLEGRLEGEQEGAYKNALKTARNLQAKGFGLDLIAEVTGLSIEELKTQLGE